ncbi:MAG TPA: hypothetical protein VHA55_12160 [Pseudorhodoplanes sp.]|jgi:hypothetical protein|nr:hypothetical protein [Pseudorhodoplanes sp.]
MIDVQTFRRELYEARKIRLRAQAAGRYLEALVRHMNRTRRPWQVLACADPALPAP